MRLCQNACVLLQFAGSKNPGLALSVVRCRCRFVMSSISEGRELSRLKTGGCSLGNTSPVPTTMRCLQPVLNGLKQGATLPKTLTPSMVMEENVASKRDTLAMHL